MSKFGEFLNKWLAKDETAASSTEGEDAGASDKGTDAAAEGEENTAADESDTGGTEGDDAGASDKGTDAAAEGEENTAADESDNGGENDAKGDDAGASDKGTDAAASKQADPARAEFDRLVKAIGAENAGVAYANGLTYEEAIAANTAHMKAENEELKSRLAALGEMGEGTAPAACDAEKAKANGTTLEAEIRRG